ncbi:MAG: tRNA preQ1(34) S-adenosylmethionine ribosyltransferase-isomerase QueA [bacterium]
MLVADFDYELPQELIAQQPLGERDASRMLVLDRRDGSLTDARFADIGRWLKPGDLLVLNDTKVRHARVFGKLPTGGKVELLLLGRLGDGRWEALARPARKARVGTTIDFGTHRAEVLERRDDGMRIVRFEPDSVEQLLEASGELALPPYIREKCADPSRYQTVFAEKTGAVAAPTAGLHFTPEVLDRLRASGIETAIVTLHAGLGTFRPVAVEQVENHRMHAERFELSEAAAAQVNRALADGRRVVCVGTTTVRVLEGQAVVEDECRMQNAECRMQSANCRGQSDGVGEVKSQRPKAKSQSDCEGGRPERSEGPVADDCRVQSANCKLQSGGQSEAASRELSAVSRVRAGAGELNLYIYPGYEWQVCGALLTNFHLPRSTLLMLVSALAGREAIMRAYKHAIEQRYRFYSFGDAMLIV